VPAVSLNVFHRRRAERFAQLLDEANGGRRHHVRSRLDAQLAELVAIGHQASALRPAVELDPEFRTGLRAMLIATAEREGIGRTAQAPADIPTGAVPAVAKTGRFGTRGAIVVGVAVGAIAVSGMSAASENAIPGDALYRVKRSTERAQLALASSDVTKGQLYLDFARTRTAEAAAVQSDPAGFAAALSDMDADTRQGVRLLNTAAATRRDPAPLDAVAAFVTAQRLQLGGLLDQVDGVNRERTLESLSLLDQVAKRTDGLRGTLSCAKLKAAGTDKLGPKPRSCAIGAPAAQAPADRSEPRTEGGDAPAQQQQQRTQTSTGRGMREVAPAQPKVATDPAAPTAEPSEPVGIPPAQEQGVMDEVGRILGGLLG
jgi:hypothetical protein